MPNFMILEFNVEGGTRSFFKQQKTGLIIFIISSVRIRCLQDKSKSIIQIKGNVNSGEIIDIKRISIHRKTRII